MRIVNIVCVRSGTPINIDSFPIFEEQLSEDVVNKVEELFIEMIEKFVPNLSDEDKDGYLEDGFFSDDNGYEIYIIWSYSGNE
jgi:hypothetical protein